MIKDRGRKGRLLVVSSTFPRWLDDSIPPFVLELCTYLSDYFHITVLAPHYDGAKLHEYVNGVEVVRFRYGPASLEKIAYGSGIPQNLRAMPWLYLVLPFFLLSQMIAVGRLLIRGRFDAVHAHWIIPQGFCVAALKAIFANTIPLVITSHGSDLTLIAKGRWRIFFQWIVRKASALAVVSQHQKLTCINMGIAADKVKVLPMGIDTGRFASGAHTRSGRRIVFVGRLIDQKGAKSLLDAFAAISGAEADLELVIVGAGPQRSELELSVDNLKLRERVRFTAWLNKDDVAAELRSAAILVVPSLRPEGLGLTVVEGMAAGCAIVASDFDSFRQLLQDGELGILFPAGNVDALEESLLALLRDRDLLERYQRAGRSVVQRDYDWSVVASRYAELFEKHIAAGKIL